jgi:glycosyltransferase involved in cell wall biosynthesis
MYKTSYQLLMKKLDWLILYEMGLESLPFLLIAKLAGTKVAVDNCDIRLMSDYKTLRGIIRFINYEVGYLLVSPRLDLNFTISTYLEKLLRLKAPGVPLVSVLAPVDMAKFRKRRHSSKAFKDRLGLRGVSVIGYFGSIHAAKGLETLLKAAHKLLTSGKAFKLLISGNTAKNAYLLRRIEELGLSDHVVLTGYLSTDELITAMSVPDILVEPKIEHEQNRAAFPQKLAEYLAMGTPIVASAIGDIPLFLHDQENALLCQPGDPDSLAAALLRLMEDDNLKERLSQKARETAGRYFDCRIIAKQIEAAL